jgi:hypothetical protein
VSLSAATAATGQGTDVTSLSGQYQQGTQTINITGTTNATTRVLTLESTDGLKLVIDKSKSVYPITQNGTAVGAYVTGTNRLTYSNGTFEQF